MFVTHRVDWFVYRFGLAWQQIASLLSCMHCYCEAIKMDGSTHLNELKVPILLKLILNIELVDGPNLLKLASVAQLEDGQKVRLLAMSISENHELNTLFIHPQVNTKQMWLNSSSEIVAVLFNARSRITALDRNCSATFLPQLLVVPV